MAKSVMKIGSFTATTSGTVAVTPPSSFNSLASYHGGYRSNYWVEITAVGDGSGWATGSAFKWQSPGGNALVIGTIGIVTSTTQSALLSVTTALAAATAMANPPITHVQVTNQTAGTVTSISGDIYIIPAD